MRTQVYLEKGNTELERQGNQMSILEEMGGLVEEENRRASHGYLLIPMAAQWNFRHVLRWHFRS